MKKFMNSQELTGSRTMMMEKRSADDPGDLIEKKLELSVLESRDFASSAPDSSLCLCTTDALKRPHHRQRFLHPVKVVTSVALKKQSFGVRLLARPAPASVSPKASKVASIFSSSFLVQTLCLLSLPVLIGCCSVRPRPQPVEEHPHEESSVEIVEVDVPGVPGNKPCNKRDTKYWCRNGGSCVLILRYDSEAWERMCICLPPWGGVRCNVTVPTDLFDSKPPADSAAAIPAIVVLVIAIAIICSSGLYFYRRHLKGKAETRYSFLSRSHILSAPKALSVKYRSGMDMHSAEEQPLNCNQLLDGEKYPSRKIQRFVSV